MGKKRKDDTGQTPNRQQHRCYSLDGDWYFELRGGGQHGPYDTREKMEAALNEFISLHEEIKAREKY